MRGTIVAYSALFLVAAGILLANCSNASLTQLSSPSKPGTAVARGSANQRRSA
jgi:uncharacterized lipoprotein YajG